MTADRVPFLTQRYHAGIKQFTLNVAKASEAISKVDISTYLKKSLNCSEKSMILAKGSCRMHSLSIIPQRKAIFGDSYLKNKKKQKRSKCRRTKINGHFSSNGELCSIGIACARGDTTRGQQLPATALYPPASGPQPKAKEQTHR